MAISLIPVFDDLPRACDWDFHQPCSTLHWNFLGTPRPDPGMVALLHDLFSNDTDAALFSQHVTQLALLPFNALYFASHTAPLIGLVSSENIREGTSWKYFGTELVLFLCLCIAAPQQFLDSWPGRAVLAFHLPLHVGLVVGDYFSHDAVPSPHPTRDRPRHPHPLP